MPLEHTLLSSLPVSQVFAYLSRFHRVVEWDPSVVAARKCTPGPVGVGTCFEVDLHFLGQTSRLVYSLREYRPGVRLVLQGEAPRYRVTDTLQFESTPEGGTRLHYRLEVEYRPPLDRLAVLLAPLVRRNMMQGIAGLARALNPLPLPVKPYPAWRDRLLLPGLLEFTRWGFRQGKPHWQGQGLDLADRTFVVTGASSGLGRATTLALAERGARVVAVVRDRAKGDALQQAVEDLCGSRVELEHAELSSLEETRALAGRLQQRLPVLHGLINNAGALFNTRIVTTEGLEKSFALLLASPCLLTEELLPLLRRQAGARVINVVSGGLYSQPLRLDDLQYVQTPYNGAKAYARAKRGLLDMTREWALQPENAGMCFHAMHPGWADTQAVADSLPGFYRFMRPWLRTPEQGADTIVWLASATEVAHYNGDFWLDRRPHLSSVLPGTETPPAVRARLREALQALWEPRI